MSLDRVQMLINKVHHQLVHFKLSVPSCQSVFACLSITEYICNVTHQIHSLIFSARPYQDVTPFVPNSSGDVCVGHICGQARSHRPSSLVLALHLQQPSWHFAVRASGSNRHC